VALAEKAADSAANKLAIAARNVPATDKLEEFSEIQAQEFGIKNPINLAPVPFLDNSKALPMR
jgi:hypothetical protein